MTDLHRLEFPVDFPPDHVAAYLLDGPEPVLVDAGPFGAAGARGLRAALAAVGREPADVEHLLLTHFHTDHVGQVGLLRDEAAPTLHLPTTFRQRLTLDRETVRKRALSRLRRTGLPPDRVETALENVAPPHGRMREQVPPAAVVRWFEPGTAVDVGGLTVRPIHTPGHDETHVSYLLDRGAETALVAGDMVLRPFRTWIVRTGWITGLEGAVADFESALDRLATVDADRVYPGHGPVHDDLTATVERDRAGLRDRLEAVASTVPDGGASAAALTDELAGMAAESDRLLPEVVAALSALERAGRVAAHEEAGVRVYHATGAGLT